MPDARERLIAIALEVAATAPQQMHRKVKGDFAQRKILARELDIEPLD